MEISFSLCDCTLGEGSFVPLLCGRTHKKSEKSFCQNTFYKLLQVQQSYFSLTGDLGKFSCIAIEDPGDKAY